MKHWQWMDDCGWRMTLVSAHASQRWHPGSEKSLSEKQNKSFFKIKTHTRSPWCQPKGRSRSKLSSVLLGYAWRAAKLLIGWCFLRWSSSGAEAMLWCHQRRSDPRSDPHRLSEQQQHVCEQQSNMIHLLMNLLTYESGIFTVALHCYPQYSDFRLYFTSFPTALYMEFTLKTQKNLCKLIQVRKTKSSF